MVVGLVYGSSDGGSPATVTNSIMYRHCSDFFTCNANVDLDQH